MSTQAYEIKVRDHRRVQPVGRDGVEVTGVYVRSRGMPGAPVNTYALHTVKLAKAEEANDDDEADNLHEPADRPVLDGGTKDFMGWRCAYRTAEPERPQRAAVLARMERKHARFASFNLPAARRHDAGEPAALRLLNAAITKTRKQAELDELRPRRSQPARAPPLPPPALPPITHGYAQVGGSSGSNS